MIIYNVSVKVDHTVVEDWVQWMKKEHIPEILSTGLFTDARLCHILEQVEDDGKTFVAQYFCESLEQYNRYIDVHALEMRTKAFDRFGNKFIAMRTVMEAI